MTITTKYHLDFLESLRGELRGLRLIYNSDLPASHYWKSENRILGQIDYHQALLCEQANEEAIKEVEKQERIDTGLASLPIQTRLRAFSTVLRNVIIKWTPPVWHDAMCGAADTMDDAAFILERAG